MDMETSLACSSAAAAAALIATSFFSLSALLRVSVCQRSTSAAPLRLSNPVASLFAPTASSPSARRHRRFSSAAW
jgi:hypothetical protein